MRTFPLFRTQLSNERLMSALVVVLLLYNLPRFFSIPGSIPSALLLVAVGLSLDAAAQFIIHKRLMCAVSGSVTALILYTLSPGIPVLPLCAALAAALIGGKAVWGGTGKNLFNPAILGLVLLGFFYPTGFAAANPLLIAPAALLALPFLVMRPYAAAGYMAGMAASLLLFRNPNPTALLGSGIIFWGCLVITDPVTTTARPAAGFVIGLLSGFVPTAVGGSGQAQAMGILAANVLSRLADRYDIGPSFRRQWSFGKTQKVSFSPADNAFIDGTVPVPDCAPASALSGDEMLARITSSGVFGCGGAAFPATRKIRTVMESKAPEKHLIVNAAECDPGLIHDKWLLVNRSAEIEKGIGCLARIIPFSSITVAAKDFYGAIFDAPVKMHRLRDYYPAGAEKYIIREVLNFEPAAGTLPAASGILVMNIQTVLAVWEAVSRNRKADSRYLTVADLASLKGTVVRAALGATVLETAQRVFPNAVNVYTGGGAMGARLSGDGDTITEKTNLIAVGAPKGFREAACSQCDVCSAFCPSGLRVRDIAHLVDAGNTDSASLLQPGNCLDCGLCSAVCLAGRDQAARVRTAKLAAPGNFAV
jgi:Na+-translocating ferredoxin:NAD+ oxidoreductase RnfD subunit/ferredoxin